MIVSILGSNGFLSSVVANYFYAEGNIVNVYGLECPKYKYNNYININLVKQKVNYIELAKSDIIIYAIGAGIQSNLHENSSLIYLLNVTSPVEICLGLKDFEYSGIFITFGSVFEIGISKEEHLFTEEDILTATSVAPTDYVVSKRMFSRFITSLNVPFVTWHFILPTIYGENENPLRLIPYTINSIRNNRRLNFTSGSQIRQYIYVDEIVTIIEKSIKCNLNSGIYNCQGPETLTIYEIVKLIHNVMHHQLSNDCFGKVSRTDTEMKYLALDGKKLSERIGYEAHILISDIISKY